MSETLAEIYVDGTPENGTVPVVRSWPHLRFEKFVCANTTIEYKNKPEAVRPHLMWGLSFFALFIAMVAIILAIDAHEQIRRLRD